MMIIAALLLATSCADARACPSDEAVRQALRTYEEKLATESVAARNTTLAPDQPIHLFHARRPQRVTDIYCAAPAQVRPNAVTCTMTSHFETGRDTAMLLLVRSGDAWVLEQGLHLFRPS